MGSDSDDKYGGNARNLWKKVYGYQNKKPQMVSVVDSITQLTHSLDLNKTLRHRDFFIIGGINSGSQTIIPLIFPFAQYDEGLVLFNSIGTVATASFNFTFSSVPYIVLSVESASLYGENLNVFGGSVTTNTFNFSLSAPFAGSVRYRAIYATSYPAVATSPYTASITASAGSVAPGGVAFYTASFATLPGVPFKYLDTAWEYIGISNGSADAAFTHGTSSSNNATVEISAPMYSTIDFIAFYTT